jgi:glycosidase
MKGSRGGANTDANRRLAMLWNDGDTVANPSGSTYSSQIENGVAEQLNDKDSLYTYYKKLIMIRHANPEIARGEFTAYSVPGSKVGGFFASYRGSTVLVLHNTTQNAATVDLSGLGVSELRAVIGLEDARLDGTTLTLGAQTSVVLK